VGALVDREVAAMTEMSKSAQRVIADLHMFSQETKADHTKAERENKAIALVLEEHSGNILELKVIGSH